jgi:hypothetical protein
MVPDAPREQLSLGITRMSMRTTRLSCPAARKRHRIIELAQQRVARSCVSRAAAAGANRKDRCFAECVNQCSTATRATLWVSIAPTPVTSSAARHRSSAALQAPADSAEVRGLQRRRCRQQRRIARDRTARMDAFGRGSVPSRTCSALRAA